MNTILVDALQCLTDNLVVGVTVETWIARDRADYRQGAIIRRVQSNVDEIEYFCSTNEEWAGAIHAVATLAKLPRNLSDWDDQHNGSSRDCDPSNCGVEK